jgi:hypothetical protein
MKQISAASPQVCLITDEQPFFGTAFVLQKTCVTTVIFRDVP